MGTFKTHVALRVADLNRSIAFYQAMFDARPVKHKTDYAKFDLENPGLNLTLNVEGDFANRGSLDHLGVQVDSSASLEAAISRFKAAGLATFEQKDTSCCYALQDKVWVTDPDNNRWEIFVIKVADTTPDDNLSEMGTPARLQNTCCS